MTFQNIITHYGLSPAEYLHTAKRHASKWGYDPSLLKFADSSGHKLSYDGVEFGDENYLDYILYTMLAHKKLITKKEADKRRSLYLTRATKINGNWKNDMRSKNNLAIHILW